MMMYEVQVFVYIILLLYYTNLLQHRAPSYTHIVHAYCVGTCVRDEKQIMGSRAIELDYARCLITYTRSHMAFQSIPPSYSIYHVFQADRLEVFSCG